MEENKVEEKEKLSIKDRIKNLSKKQIIIIFTIVVVLIIIISILNTFNRRTLDIVNREISYGDVKNIEISHKENSVKYYSI